MGDARAIREGELGKKKIERESKDSDKQGKYRKREEMWEKWKDKEKE